MGQKLILLSKYITFSIRLGEYVQDHKNNSNSSTTGILGEMPLEFRRVQLSLNYWNNLHSQDHPAQSSLNPCWEKERRETTKFWMDTESESSTIQYSTIKCSSNSTGTNNSTLDSARGYS